MTKLRAALLTFALLPFGAAQAGDLITAWRAAREHDPQYLAAAAQYAAGQQKERQGLALRLPQVNATVLGGVASARNEMRGAEFSATPLGALSGAHFKSEVEHGHEARWSVSAQQPIYDAARFAAARQLERGSVLAELQFRSAEQQLALRVARAYFGVLSAEDKLQSIQAQRRAAHAALQMAEEQFAVGEIAAVDRHEAQARDDALAAQELAASGELELAQSTLRDLTGTAPAQLAHLPDDGATPLRDVGVVDHWLVRASNSPVVQAQAVARDIAADEVEKYRALKSPTLNLVAQAGNDRLANGPNEIAGRSSLVGVQLNIPIFTGGMRSAKLDEAQALSMSARSELDASRQSAERQTRAAWLGVSVGQARVKALTQAERSARLRLDATRLGREAGDRSTLDVLNAEHDYYGTLRDLHQARFDVLLALLELRAAVGELDAGGIAEIDALLTARRP